MYESFEYKMDEMPLYLFGEDTGAVIGGNFSGSAVYLTETEEWFIEEFFIGRIRLPKTSELWSSVHRYVNDRLDVPDGLPNPNDEHRLLKSELL